MSAGKAWLRVSSCNGGKGQQECDSDIDKLERVNIKAMRLITGAPSNSNIKKLYEETSLAPVRERIEHATLIMFFKIVNGLSAPYLESLLPRRNEENTNYNLRNKKNICIPYARLEIFKKSFLHRAIRLWNLLEINHREGIGEFKIILKQSIPERKVIYFYGERWPSMHHAKIRMGCSSLNYDLGYKLHVSNDPSCPCGAPLETALHFFLHCPRYTNIRFDMINEIEKQSRCSLDIILFGNNEVDAKKNIAIFDAVHNYIQKSKRFCK